MTLRKPYLRATAQTDTVDRLSLIRLYVRNRDRIRWHLPCHDQCHLAHLISGRLSLLNLKRHAYSDEQLPVLLAHPDAYLPVEAEP